MSRLKSILKTLGLWLAFVAATIFGSLALILVKLSPVLGWILAGITLSLLVFLFITRRRLFKIPIIILTVLWLFWFMNLLTFGGNKLGSTNIFWLFIVAVFYFFGAWLMLKQGILKVIGVLLVLAVSFAGGLVSTAPDYSRLAMMSNRLVWALMAGMGIFMVTRKGIGLRLLGVGLIIATILTVFMAFFSYSSSYKITGKDKAAILAGAEPRINDLFEAWNNNDYQKFSQNLTDKNRRNYGQDKFLSGRDRMGKLISKSGSSTVVVRAGFIEVTDAAVFEKYPDAAFTVLFQKYDNKYLVDEFSFAVAVTNSEAPHPTTTPSPTTYTYSLHDSATTTIERYECSTPKFNKNQADALAPNVSLSQKIKDEFTQLNSELAQLNEMGSQNSTNNYNAVTDDYNAHKATYEADQKQYDSEAQAFKNYLKTRCTYIGN